MLRRPCTCGVRSTTAPSHGRNHYDKHINDCHSHRREQPRFRLIEKKTLSSELCKHSGSFQLTGILSWFTPAKQRLLTHYVPLSLLYDAAASKSTYLRYGDVPEVVGVQQHDLCEHCRSQRHLDEMVQNTAPASGVQGALDISELETPIAQPGVPQVFWLCCCFLAGIHALAASYIRLYELDGVALQLMSHLRFDWLPRRTVGILSDTVRGFCRSNRRCHSISGRRFPLAFGFMSRFFGEGPRRFDYVVVAALDTGVSNCAESELAFCQRTSVSNDCHTSSVWHAVAILVLASAYRYSPLFLEL